VAISHKGVRTMEKLLIDKHQLAELCSISHKTIEKRPGAVAGAMKIGRVWRFNLNIIKDRISKGKSIFVS